MKRSSFPIYTAFLVLAFMVTASLAQPQTNTNKPSSPASKSAEKSSTVVGVAPQPTAGEHIAQGKSLYRKGQNDLALKRFLSAITLDPMNDEALGYASLIAFQLGEQEQARDLFRQRAEVQQQKASVKLFCTYMIALTHWRQAHVTIAKAGELTLPITKYQLSEEDMAAVKQHLLAGLAAINTVIAKKLDYAEAYNVQNLLHSEAALISDNEDEQASHRQAAMQSLRQSIKFHKAGASGDFGAPTILVGEYAMTNDDQSKLTDPMLARIEGGLPLLREEAFLPVVKYVPPKIKRDSNNPVPTGVGPGGSAVSIGPHQGALRPSRPEIVKLEGGIAKVEVLISPAGNVVFARIVAAPAAATGPALEAAKKWKFSVPRFEGQPVQILGVITFDVQDPPEQKDKGKTEPPAKPTATAKKKSA